MRIHGYRTRVAQPIEERKVCDAEQRGWAAKHTPA